MPTGGLPTAITLRTPLNFVLNGNVGWPAHEFVKKAEGSAADNPNPGTESARPLQETFCDVDKERFLAAAGVNSVVSQNTTGPYAPQSSSRIVPDRQIGQFNLTPTNAARVGVATTVPDGFDSCLIAVDSFMANTYAKSKLFPISLYLRFMDGELNYTGTASAWN